MFGINFMVKFRSILSSKSITPNKHLCPWCWLHGLVGVPQIEGSVQLGVQEDINGE